jgi:hypothetical protein
MLLASEPGISRVGANYAGTGSGNNIHVDFVGGISADHVQNGQLTAGVLVDPFVQLQRIAFVDNNGLALGNQGFDFSSGHELLGRHYGGGCVRERAQGYVPGGRCLSI